MLGLLGILEAGRGIAAPLSVGGEWNVELEAHSGCAATLRQPALSISQSGPDALITLNDAHAIVLNGKIDGATLTAGSLTATIAGAKAQRTLEGKMNLDGCGPVAFRALRQVAKKRGE